CQDRIIAADLKEEDTEFRKMRVIIFQLMLLKIELLVQ
ncbi:unnamed protein product, partial [marine sediment metagenome]